MDTRIADGAFGPFEGPATDLVVLPRYASQNAFSDRLVALLGGFLDGGGTLIDVGAHVGLISIPVARRANVRCIAFEPAPLNAACLRRNVERHGVAQQVAVHELALGECAGRIAFALCAENSGDNYVLAEDAGSDSASSAVVEVESARLDDVIDAATLAKPIVLKLDVQGAEVKVLTGARNTLQHVSAVVLEYWPRGLLRAGDHAAQLESLLDAFPWGAVLKQDGGKLEPKTRAELFHALAHFMAHDGSDDGFFDLLLTSGRDLIDGAGS
jgi:FkbM family methyltransferase